MYRQGAHLSCLICKQGPLEPESDGLRCPNGCGFWDPTIPRVDGTPLSELGWLIDPQLHPRTCPVCRGTMQIRRWAGVTFDVCAGHGVWIADEHVERYWAQTGYTVRRR